MSGFLSKNALSFSEMSWVMQKVKEIKYHSAWNDKTDEIAAERMLNSEMTYTYLLRPGKDMYHYFLSYVDVDGSVHHKMVKIELSAKGWIYRNGTATVRETLEDLIPVALHCSVDQCRPVGNTKFAFSF